MFQIGLRLPQVPQDYFGQAAHFLIRLLQVRNHDRMHTRRCRGADAVRGIFEDIAGSRVAAQLFRRQEKDVRRGFSVDNVIPALYDLEKGSRPASPSSCRTDASCVDDARATGIRRS